MVRIPVIRILRCRIMLIGNYQHNIDPKGRVIMPAKFREELGEIFYATKGKDNTITVLSKQAWDELGKKIAAMPSSGSITSPVPLRISRWSLSAAIIMDSSCLII